MSIARIALGSRNEFCVVLLDYLVQQGVEFTPAQLTDLLAFTGQTVYSDPETDAFEYDEKAETVKYLKGPNINARWLLKHGAEWPDVLQWRNPETEQVRSWTSEMITWARYQGCTSALSDAPMPSDDDDSEDSD